MDRRDFFKKAGVTTLGLIFAPAVAKVLAEEAPEIIMGTDPIRAGEGLWAYVTRNGVTQYYAPGQLCMEDLEILQNPPGWNLVGQHVYRTGKVGIEAFKKAAYDYQAFWLRFQAALENEKKAG